VIQTAVAAKKKEMKGYIHIYSEANPNPNSMKFVINEILLSDGKTMEYLPTSDTSSSPLAQAVFDRFDFVNRIFIMSNFLTLTKDEHVDWLEVSPVIRAFLREYFEEEKPVFSETEDFKGVEVTLNNDSEAVKKIKGVLDEYIKPAVEMDGGAITFDSFDPKEGIVKVRLQGSCSGCPSSTITLKSGIENLLKRMVPEVREVQAQND